MSILKANQWTKNDGTVYNHVVNMETITVGYHATNFGSAAVGTNLSQGTINNTNSLFKFSYTPVTINSKIIYTAFLDVDANNAPSGAYTAIWFFINGVPYSSGYCYRRVQGNEPYHKSTSSVYINTTGQVLNFDIRCSNGGTGNCFLGRTADGSQSLSNTINIIEVQT
jgi:hypothetical protein